MVQNGFSCGGKAKDPKNKLKVPLSIGKPQNQEEKMPQKHLEQTNSHPKH